MTDTRTKSYTPAAGTQVLPTTFPLMAAEEMTVTRTRGGTSVVLALDTDYTVAGVGDVEASAILTTASLDGDSYTLNGATPYERVSDFSNEIEPSGDQIDDELNRALWRDEELRRDLDASGSALSALEARTVRVGYSETIALVTSKALRANKFFMWDANGDPTVASLDLSAAMTVQTISNVTALAAIADPVAAATVFVADSARPGWWTWRAGNYSALNPAVNDPGQALYVVSGSVAVTSGVWQRMAPPGFAYMSWFNGATTDLKTANAATAINAGLINALCVDAIYNITTTIPAFLKADCDIYGMGYSCSFAMDAATVSGKIMSLGDGVTSGAARIRVHNMALQHRNQSNGTGHAIWVDGCDDAQIFHCRFIGVSGVVRVGATSTCSRLRYRDCNGTVRTQSGEHYNLFEKWTGNFIDNVYYTGTTSDATAATGSGFRFAPTGATTCDTVWMTSCSVFIKGGVAKVFDVDASFGPAVNFFVKQCAFDKANTSCIWLGMTAGTYRIRNVIFDDCRTDTSASTGLTVSQGSTDLVSGVYAHIENVQFNGGFLLAENTAVVKVTEAIANTVKGFTLNGPTIEDTNQTGESCDALIEMGVSYFTIANCSTILAQAEANWPFTSRHNAFVKITADVNNFTIANNRSPHHLQRFIKHYAYANRYDPSRVIIGNSGLKAEMAYVQ